MAMQPVGSGIKIVRFVDEDEASIDVAAWRREQIARANRYQREVAKVRPDLVTPKPAPKASPAPRAAQPPKPAQPSPAQQIKALNDQLTALNARLDTIERIKSAQREQARRDQEARLMNTFRW